MPFYYILISSYLKIKMIEIPDDPSVVMPVFEELKRNFLSGETKSASFRKRTLERFLEGYNNLKEEFSQALQKDLGMTAYMSHLSNHAVTIAQTQQLIEKVDKWMKPRSVETPVLLTFASSEIKYEPLGVVLVVSAWNYPVYTCISPVVTAIGAGNCVITKPSELAPYTSNVIKKLFDNYLDKRFYRCIQGKIQVAKAVTKLPLDLICFTGSTFTGKLVAIEAAKNLTPCILELGGKCPIIVDETAKIQPAVLKIILGKYLNCGQTCIGVDHVYIHESIYNNFKNVLLRKMQETYGTKELLIQSEYGKIVNLMRVKRLEELLSDKHQGNVIFGGQVQKDQLFISPTVVEKPSEKSLMMNEEIFGPIMPIFSYSNLDSLVKEINQREKPLVVYMFSERKASIEMVRDGTSSGAFVVNETITQMASSHLPFGGVGKSGYGRLHGETGFINFSNPKSVCYTSSFNAYPLNCRFPPFTEKNKSTIVGLLKTGTMTYSQIYRGLFIVILLITIGLVVGLVVVPHFSNQ